MVSEFSLSELEEQFIDTATEEQFISLRHIVTAVDPEPLLLTESRRRTSLLRFEITSQEIAGKKSRSEAQAAAKNEENLLTYHVSPVPWSKSSSLITSAPGPYLGSLISSRLESLFML